MISQDVPIANEFPKGMRGIILQNICFSNQQRYVSCTVLVEKLECHHIYDNFLFEIIAVQKYLSRCSIDHVVINRLTQNGLSQLSLSM